MKNILCKLGFHKLGNDVVVKNITKPSYKGRKPHKYRKKYAVCKRCGKHIPL